MADQALIKQIMDEVKDPALRDKLLAAVIANEPLNGTHGNILAGMGLSPDAAKKTISFQLIVNTIGCVVFFVIGCYLWLGAVESQDNPMMGKIFVFGSPVIWLINRVYYGNFIYPPQQGAGMDDDKSMFDDEIRRHDDW